LAVLACPGCVSRYVGGQFVSLYGVGLDSLQTIAVAGRLTSFELSTGLDVTDAEVAAVLASIGQQYATRLQAVRFLSPALVTVNSSANGTASLSLTSRRLLENPRSAYQTLTLRSSYARGDGSDQPLELNYTRLLYYSSSTCLSAGEWKEDGLGGCLLCPTGGFCPGGGRVWPQAGYWSWNEFQAPMACAIPEACPGVDAASGGSHNADNAAGAGFTQQCSADYSGPTCAQCSAGAYRLNGRCYQCTESSTDQNAILSLTIIVGLSLMGGLSLAVAFLPAMRLAEVIQLLLIVQGLAMVGVEAAKDLPLFKQEVSAVFSYLNFVNADVEVLRPGCGGVPDFTYVDKLRLSLLFMLITACMFLAGCVLRFLFHRRRGGTVQQAGARTVAVHDEEEEEERSQSAVSRNARQSSKLRATDGALPTSDELAVPSASVAPTITLRPLSAALDFKYRAIHAFLILLALFYLRLSILFFKAFRCIEAADPLADPDAAADDTNVETTTSYVLEEDMQTLCYTGEHLAVAVGVSILLLCYSFGFPVLTFGLLVRAFGDQYHTEGLLGWMRRNCAWLRPRIKRPLRALVVERPGGDANGDAAAVDRPAVVANNGWVAESGSKYAAPPSSVRAQVEAARKQRMREAAFGFLFLEFRHAAFFSIALVFLSSLTFAAVNVYLLSTLPKLFCFGLIWTAQLLCMLLWLPYADWRMNLKNVVVGFGSLAHSVVLLGLQTDGSTSALFFVLLLFFLLLLALLCVRGQVAKALPWLDMADSTLLFRIGVGANKVQPEVSANCKMKPLSDPSPCSSRSSGSPQRSGPDTGTNGSSSSGSGSGRGEREGGGGATGGSGGSQVHPLPLALASPSQQGGRSSRSAIAASPQLHSPSEAAVVSPTSLRQVNVAAAAPSPPSQMLRGQTLPPLLDPMAPSPSSSSSAPSVPPPAASSDDAADVELQRIASSSLPSSSSSSATNRSRPSSAARAAAAIPRSAATAAGVPSSRPSLLAPGVMGTVGGGGAAAAAGGKAPLQLAPLRVNKTKPMSEGAV
jgi:uncharacterized membrane protein YgcG